MTPIPFRDLVEEFLETYEFPSRANLREAVATVSFPIPESRASAPAG